MGMKCFEIFPSEKSVLTDRISGVSVTQLTSCLGHSYHTYFTNNGWWDNGRRLLFTSDRNNARNLCSIEIESGEISRLTDFKPGEMVDRFCNDVNPVRPEVYFIKDKGIYAVDFTTLEIRKLYQSPKGFLLRSGGLVSADGKYVYTLLMEDLSNRLYYNLSASYIGFADVCKARPDCRILRIEVETGKSEEIWQENCWIGHINPSPTQPDFITFCHEGPWDMVDHRMWFMDTRECKPQMLRPRKMEGEQIGHEYWYADGLRVGYQAHKPGQGSYFGVIDYDGKNDFEAPCVPFPSPDHVHSNDFNLIVSDSGTSIKLYRYNGTDFDEARVLCMHDGSFFYGSHHPHPRFNADGKHILYNSNVSGYCQMYLVEVPDDVTALPKVVDVL